LTLNPRASVFRHNDGVYLFDPITLTCASMNEAMFSFISGPDDAGFLDKLSSRELNELRNVAERLHRLGILIGPETVEKSDRPGIDNGTASINHLAIFVTSKCNLKCAYCYAQGGDEQKTIGRDIWLPAMDYYFSTIDPARKPDVNMAIHGGGEATMEFDVLKQIVDEFFARAQVRGLKPSVNMGSNGTYNESVSRWIIRNGIQVTISLDGPRDIQNRLRPFRSGQPSYDVVVRNLKALLKAGRQGYVRATVTSESLDYMEETVELAGQLGIGIVHFEPVTLTGRGNSGRITKPDPRQFADTFLKCYLRGLALDVTVRYSGLRCFDPRYRQFCGACGRNFCVTAEGNITTCYEVLDCKDPAAGMFFIGKVDPVQKRVALDRARIQQLAQRVTENLEACRDCFLRFQCAGDCPLKSFRKSNTDLYFPDAYRCEIAERINKQLIVWLADGIIETRDAGKMKVVSLNHFSK
jgi:uncharacterized protein